MSDLQENTVIPVHRYQDKIDKWRRDEYGFLPIEYHFNEDESINWRKMIPEKYLVINKKKFPVGTDFKSLKISEQDDKNLLILLNGLKYVAKLRGYTAVKEQITPGNDFVSATCEIHWTSDFENPAGFISSGEADAHSHNTTNFAKYYLTSMAGNRAFIRAVRNGLGIEILGYDEIGDNPPAEGSDPSNQEPDNNSGMLKKAYDKLSSLLLKEDVTLEQLKNKLQLEGIISVDEAAQITSIETIPSQKILNVISLTEKRIEERKKEAKKKPKRKSNEKRN